MYHNLVFSSIVVHGTNGISNSSPSAFETRLQSLEPLAQVAVLGRICEEDLDLRLFLSVSGISCFRHVRFGIWCPKSKLISQGIPAPKGEAA